MEELARRSWHIAILFIFSSKWEPFRILDTVSAKRESHNDRPLLSSKPRLIFSIFIHKALAW